MFHQGDLQSGIALAIQQAKLVACFVRDDSPESSTWEDEWLQDDLLSTLLTQTAVLLRIQAGSLEAGFLSAFCPISKIPALVVIHNGQLREHLVSGTSREEFTSRLRVVLGGDEAKGIMQTQVSIPSEASASASAGVPDNPEAHATLNSGSSTPASSAASSTSTPSARVQALLTDRARRLEADKQLKEEAEKAARSAKAKGKQKAVEEELEAAGVSSTKSQQLSAAAQARKKKQDDRAELKRIQARIEADKQERKAREDARRAVAAEEAERRRQEQAELVEAEAQATSAKKAAVSSKNVHLNVRLFDGSTIRAYFPRTSTLQDDVRVWVDKELSSHAGMPSSSPPPYTFKHILSPLPSHTLSASDEAAALENIDLAPSATLILVSVQGFTEAYSNAGGGVIGTLYGGVTGVVSGAVGLVSGGLGLLGGALQSVTGYGAQPAQQGRDDLGEGRQVGSEPGPSAAASIRVRTLADQRVKEQQDLDRDPNSRQYYNGNQLNFEPNEDDNEK
ncbi:hypothetical protein AOQ84DRAFT_169837 [Glonium stellatum]|uniref:UBX domain-containing protein n=1 Tax=Glonium stellatum TaxID=574774 RepID=A0A8E2JMQ9_9PEZI|nr:hypothetical protein AOQ84DRAFT_169837 [Glonium stellatum]